jgi:hypothetical protein
MMMMKVIGALVLLLTMAVMAHAYGGDCQLHPDSGTYKTGKTAVIGGTLAWEYYCFRGHYFWGR